jgi:creatinine amidohydrolase
MSYYFGEKTWPEIEAAIKKDTLLILPVGTTEEHGRHLPVETDAMIAKMFGDAIAQELKDEIPLLVMQPVWYGYSQKVMTQWPGTIRLRTRTFMDMIYDILSSVIEMGFKKVVLLDCHGHHDALLKTVMREIADDYNVYIAITSPAGFSTKRFQEIRKSERGGAIHGCEWETSLIMYYRDDLVKESEFTNVDIMRYNSEFVAGDNFTGGQKVVWSTWGIQKSKTGIYGDPTCASVETGAEVVRAAIENYKKFIQEYYAANS